MEEGGGICEYREEEEREAVSGVAGAGRNANDPFA